MANSRKAEAKTDVFNNLSTKYPAIIKKKKKSNFRVQKPGRCHLN
jgi:hypothetical protein